MVKVLVTCIGSGVGQSAIDSLNLADNYYILGIDMNLDVYAAHYCNKVVKSPSIYSRGYVDFLVEICVRNNIDIIIPGHDHELGLLASHREKFRSNSIQVLVSDQRLIEISRNKYEWFEFFKQRGCNVVTTYTLESLIQNPNEHIFPAIIKPTGGSASQNISIVHNLSDVQNVYKEFGSEGFIIQPYLLPPSTDENYETLKKAVANNRLLQLSEISIQLIFNTSGKFVSSFISCNKLKNGVPVLVDTISAEDFPYLEDLNIFIKALEEQEVIGPVNLQGRVTDQGLVFFEMNMRFTGITGNRAQLGFNEVDYLVKEFLGRETQTLGYSNNQIGVRQVACTTIKKNPTYGKQTYTVLGGGFIGCNLIDNLLLTDLYDINLICRRSSLDRYQEIYSQCAVNVVCEDDPNLQSIYCQSDVVVICIGALAYNSDANIYSAIQSLYKHNIMLDRANIPTIINLSSQSVYDQSTNMSKIESSKTQINSAYAFQKKIGEEMSGSLSLNHPSSRIISLRLPRVTGQGKAGINGFFKKIIEALKNRNTIDIQYPLNNTTLINVNDVISAIKFVVNEDGELPSIMNVGGIDINMSEYCEAVASYLDIDAADLVRYGSSKEITQSSLVDGSLLASFGWKPKFTLMELIHEINLCN